ncbi:MAG: sulfate permease [Rhodothermales bacterium]|nr:sulfate permease [Rhodothermales bacterium]
MGLVRQVIPLAQWLPGYGWAALRGDVLAGLTVGVMLIPQAMAYALLAGVPPIYGLYASVAPLVVYALLGTSRHLAVGTVALDMVIVASGVSALAAVGTDAYLELVILLVMMVGALEIGMGLLRLGFVVILLSRPVISGFTSAAALIIAASQLGNLVGVAVPRSESLFAVLWDVGARIGQFEEWSLAVGVGSVLVLLAVQRWVPRVPGPILVVVASMVGVALLGVDVRGLAFVGAVPAGLPEPRLPSVEWGAVGALFPTALTLVLVQFMSVISLGKVFAARHRYDVEANRELVAIGAANLVGGVFRGIPVSGSFSRTAVNERAGARTPLANAFAAALVVVTLLLLTPLFALLPVPVLAAIIIVAALGLFDLRELRHLLHSKPIDGSIALLTFAVTLVLGLQEGILLGVGASVIAILYRISRPNVAILGHLPGTRTFVDVERNPEAHQYDGLLILRVEASFSYVNADLLKEFLLEESARRGARAILLDATSINDLDLTAAAMLINVAEQLQQRGVALYLGGVKGGVRDVMERSGLLEVLGADHLFLNPFRAARAILTAWGEEAALLRRVPGGVADEAGPRP